jgi:hypothetical protein
VYRYLKDSKYQYDVEDDVSKKFKLRCEKMRKCIDKTVKLEKSMKKRYTKLLKMFPSFKEEK